MSVEEKETEHQHKKKATRVKTVKEQLAKGRFKPAKKPGKNRKNESKSQAYARREKFYNSEKGRQGLVVRLPRCRRIMRHMRENTTTSFARLIGDEEYKKNGRNVFLREFNQTMVGGLDAAVNQLVEIAYRFANNRHGHKDKTGIKLTVKDLEDAKHCIQHLGRQ